MVGYKEMKMNGMTPANGIKEILPLTYVYVCQWVTNKKQPVVTTATKIKIPGNLKG